MTTYNIKAVIQCELQKVWETVLAVEHYHTWRRDVSEIELTVEKSLQHVQYQKNFL